MTAMRSAEKKKLSKNVMGMKFMKRSALNVEKEKNDEDAKKAIDDEHWVLDIPELKEKESEFDVEESYVVCQDLQFGRMSFHNFNPEIEKLMVSKREEQQEKESERREKEGAVDDEEMANRYANLIGTIAKKFNKRSRGKDSQQTATKGKSLDGVHKSKHKKFKSREFIKPTDD